MSNQGGVGNDLLPQSLRPAEPPLSPFGLEMLTSQLNGGRSERKTPYF